MLFALKVVLCLLHLLAFKLIHSLRDADLERIALAVRVLFLTLLRVGDLEDGLGRRVIRQVSAMQRRVVSQVIPHSRELFVLLEYRVRLPTRPTSVAHLIRPACLLLVLLVPLCRTSIYFSRKVL